MTPTQFYAVRRCPARNRLVFTVHSPVRICSLYAIWGSVVAKYLVAQVMLILLINLVITARRPEKRVDTGSIDLNASLVKKTSARWDKAKNSWIRRFILLHKKRHPKTWAAWKWKRFSRIGLKRPSRFLKPRRSCTCTVTGGRYAQSSGRRSSGHITSSRASASDAAACAAICLLGPTPRPTTCSPILTSTVNWRA